MKNDKERLREQALDKYKNLLEENNNKKKKRRKNIEKTDIIIHLKRKNKN